MAHIPLLDDLIIIAVAGLMVTLLLGRLRIPTVAGFLVAGILVGPSGLGLIENSEHIGAIAEVGVILLLFTIGLEFSLKRLRPILGTVLVGGALQVGVTIAGTSLAVWLLGDTWPRAILLGFMVALSSTAIVLRTLTERGELQAPHGRLVVGILIFQDLCVVGMVLVVPLLAGVGAGTDSPWLSLTRALGKAGAVLAVTVVLARWAMPPFLRWVDSSRSRELFVLAVVTLCVGIGWLTSLAGLSIALGAFLAGLALADSDFRHRAVGDVLPLRDLFTSIFFVSLGMLLDVSVLFERPTAVALLFAAFVVGKGVVAVLAAMIMRFPARVAWMVGAGLAQFGEFGFVLASLGQKHGLMQSDEVSTILAAGALSMLVTPMWLALAPRLSAGQIVLRPLEKLLGARGIDEPGPEHEEISNHIVVVGYGVAGRLLGEALDRVGVRYLVLELNAETVRRARAEGAPVYYGDVTSAEALEHARVRQARAVVLLVNDPEATQRAVVAVGEVAPATPILVRSAWVADAPGLYRLGAREVVAAELEAGLEMLYRIDRQLRAAQSPAPGGLALTELEVRSYLVEAGSAADGRAPGDLPLPEHSWLLAIAPRESRAFVDQISPARPVVPGDLLFVVGERRSLEEVPGCVECDAVLASPKGSP